MIHRICLLLALVALAGCGGTAKSTSLPRPAIEADYGALRWVPPSSDFVLATRKLTPFIETLAGNLPQEVQGIVGDTGQLETWTKMGIDTAQGVAAFGSATDLTVVLPVGDEAALDALWSRIRPQLNVTSHSHRGYELFEGSTLVIPGSWWWVRLDGWLVVRWSPRSTELQTVTWLDPLLDAASKESYASSPNLKAALKLGQQTGGGLPDLLGAISPRLLLDATLPAELEGLRCTGLLSSLRDLHLAARVGAEGLRASFAVELAPAAAKSLRQLLAPSVSPGMVSFRDSAGVYASIGIDLAATRAALSEAGCSGLAAELAAPLASIGWSPPPRSLHLAAANVDFDDYRGDVAIEASLRDKGFVNRLLNKVPMRSLLESTVRVAGQKAKVISVPGSPSVYYQLHKDRVVASATKKRLSTLVTRSTEGPEELVALGLRPEQLGDLTRLANSLSPGLKLLWSQAEAFRFSELLLQLKGNRLQLRAQLLW